MTNQEVREHLFKALHRFGKIKSHISSGVGELTKGEFFCMGVIADRTRRRSERSGVQVWDLAGHMQVRPPAGSRMLRGLEERGHIRREVDPADRRNVRVSLTESGREVWQREAEGYQRTMDRVIDRMGPENMETLLDLLDRLAAAIEEEQNEETGIC